MSQTPRLFSPSPSGLLEKEAEARGIDSNLLRKLLDLRQDGTEDPGFLESAIESAVQRKLNDRFFSRSQRIRWELVPYDWTVLDHKSPV